MESVTLRRCQQFAGCVRMSASKSIANRALLLSGLVAEQMRIENLPPLTDPINDIVVAIEALRMLGAHIEIQPAYKNTTANMATGSVVVSGQIESHSGGTQHQPQEQHQHQHQHQQQHRDGGDPRHIFVQNAGTVMRMLAAILCAGEGFFILDGDSDMRKRPIGDLVDALAAHGVDIRCRDGKFPPVEIRASGFAGGEMRISGAQSSQFLSGLLLAAPLARQALHIRVTDTLASAKYINLTLQVMESFGVKVKRVLREQEDQEQEDQDQEDQTQAPTETQADEEEQGQTFLVEPQKYVAPADHVFFVEGDVSSASYFFAAGALPNGCVSVEGIDPDTSQPDIGFLDILERMGAKVTREKPHRITVSNRGDAAAKAAKSKTNTTSGASAGGGLRGVEVDMHTMPDAALTLAVLAIFANGPTTIKRIGHLRYKESDRLNGLLSQLRKTGAKVDLQEDTLIIHPLSTERGRASTESGRASTKSGRASTKSGRASAQMATADVAEVVEIETYGDHRMVMAFSLLAYRFDVRLKQPQCVAKSYPNFLEDFRSIMRHAPCRLDHAPCHATQAYE